jgi:hypothetical protein
MMDNFNSVHNQQGHRFVSNSHMIHDRFFAHDLLECHRSSPDIFDVPPIVARYFRWALSEGQRFVQEAWIRSAGSFLVGSRGGWSVFGATQHFTVEPPSFVWAATVYMMRMFPIHVRDSYQNGEGALRARLLGMIPVANRSGTTQLAEATLQRFLTEAVWFPTALLPRIGLYWTPVDDVTATATISDHGHTVSADFHFEPDGVMTGATALRYRDVKGVMELTPWQTHVWDYTRVDGMMVPTNAMAEWVTPTGPLPYWRGRLSDFRYTFAP